jgi:phosphoribosylanthranilate isomerase
VVEVKICGITNLEDALASIEFGADMLGFNFVEGSPRCLSPESALKIIDRLPQNAGKVGVFVNMEEYRVDECIDLFRLDAAQLHGDESNGYIDELKRYTSAKVIKAFRVGNEFSYALARDCNAEAILLDAYAKDKYGGTGETFDWEIAKEMATLTSELYLAGGLNPDNVAEAVRTVRPYAVDVASGVESSPGKKDPKKLEAFIRNAKNA